MDVELKPFLIIAGLWFFIGFGASVFIGEYRLGLGIMRLVGAGVFSALWAACVLDLFLLAKRSSSAAASFSGVNSFSGINMAAECFANVSALRR